MGFTLLPEKQAGLALIYLNNIAPENWTASCVITVHLSAAFLGQGEFRIVDYTAILSEGWDELCRRNVLWLDTTLAETLTNAPNSVSCLFWRVTKTGA